MRYPRAGGESACLRTAVHGSSSSCKRIRPEECRRPYMRRADRDLADASAACGLRRLKSGDQACACLHPDLRHRPRETVGTTEIVGCSAGWPWARCRPRSVPASRLQSVPCASRRAAPRSRTSRRFFSIELARRSASSTSARTARSISAAVTSLYVLCCAMTGRSARPEALILVSDRAEALFHTESLDHALRDLGCFGEVAASARPFVPPPCARKG